MNGKSCDICGDKYRNKRLGGDRVEEGVADTILVLADIGGPIEFADVELADVCADCHKTIEDAIYERRIERRALDLRERALS